MRWLAAVAVAAIVGLLLVALRDHASARASRTTAGDAPAPPPFEPGPEPDGGGDIVVSEALGGRGKPADEDPPADDPGPERRPDPPWGDERQEAPTPAEAPVRIEGRLSVESDAAPSGTLRLTWSWGQGWNQDTIEVNRGAWSAEVPSGSTLRFDRIRLSGRLAVAVEPKTVAPASGQVAVACRWFVPTTLRVLDADTGAELTGVEVVDAGFGSNSLHPGPGYLRTVAAGATSPVTLPEKPDEQVYWVRAPDRAWTRVEVEQSFGGERVVRLPKAGGLDVRLSNFDPDSGAEVRLYDITDSHLLSWPSDERPRIESLAPGTYRVRVEIGAWYREPRRLGEALVEVEPGVVREVTIDVAGVPGPEIRVPLKGTLHVDPGWGDDVGWIHLSVEGEDVPPGTDDPDVMLSKDGRWSAGWVPPGRYAVNVRPWTWCQLVDVGPSGNPDVRIVVPPPCDVEVRVLFEDRDEAAPIDRLYWGMRLGSCLEDVSPHAPGRFRFRAPLGEIEFDESSDNDFVVEARALELKPGLNRVTLRARRLFAFTIELEDAITGTKLPVDDGFWARITVAGVDDPECRAVDTSFSSTIRVTKPGRYRVMFLAEIDGFRSIDDHEVEVPPEGTARLIVRLRRK